MFEEKHVDILKEVINIGIGEAAAALSDLVDGRVNIHVPEVKIMAATDIPEYLKADMEDLGVYISQVFQGQIAGKSVLCYSKEASRSLLEIIMGTKIATLSLSDSDTETLQEVGNLILVSCLSAISNMIEDRFIFDMPHVTLNGHIPYFKDLIKDIMEFEQAVVVKTGMLIKEINVMGYIFILLSLPDIRIFIKDIFSQNLLSLYTALPLHPFIPDKNLIFCVYNNYTQIKSFGQDGS